MSTLRIFLKKWLQRRRGIQKYLTSSASKNYKQHQTAPVIVQQLKLCLSNGATVSSAAINFHKIEEFGRSNFLTIIDLYSGGVGKNL